MYFEPAICWTHDQQAAVPSQLIVPNKMITVNQATNQPEDEAGKAQKVMMLCDKALKTQNDTTDVASALLKQLSLWTSKTSVEAFLPMFRPVIDALGGHFAIRKTHKLNPVDYKREHSG